MATFLGKALPLSKEGFEAARKQNAIDGATLWSILAIETSGCGFLPDRRPKILFERHIFSKLTGRKHDAKHPDISSPEPGGYGALGAHQYDRLSAAIKLDSAAAKKSASWGLGQIMGMNHKAAGFADVDSMIAEMVASENGQLKAMAAFIGHEGMDKPLREHKWTEFARRYNGPNFAENKYDKKLKMQFETYLQKGTPDLLVRAVQVYLMYRGFNPGTIDGIPGTATKKAAKEFQVQNNLPATGIIDEKLLAALASPPRAARRPVARRARGLKNASRV